METIMTKQEKIDQIVQDAKDDGNYREFAADCVREIVSEWDTIELNAWFGIEEKDE